MGDFNAKVGSDNAGLERVMGRHGLGIRNGNGELLADFCNANQLAIGGTLFPHKTCHKVTWESPDGRTKNQIDHFLIQQKWRKCLHDVRSKTSADAGSDHHMVVARVQLHIAAIKRPTGTAGRIKFIIDALRDQNTSHCFVQTLSDKMALNSYEPDNASVENIWSSVRKAF